MSEEKPWFIKHEEILGPILGFTLFGGMVVLIIIIPGGSENGGLFVGSLLLWLFLFFFFGYHLIAKPQKEYEDKYKNLDEGT